VKIHFIKDICKMKWVLIKSEPHLSVLINFCFETKYSFHKKWSSRVYREENLKIGFYLEDRLK
jgi:hypothetical protein